MDTPAEPKPIKINRWLPYWAVFQADVGQTLTSWVYRTWVLVSVVTTVGYLLYRVGVFKGAGIVQSASGFVSELLRWTVLGSVTLIIMLTAGSISSERGTLADSVLSRGISRYQYFLGKLHARLFTVLVTFFVMGAAALVSSYFLLDEDLTWGGSAVALATVAALLAVVTTFGVTASALSNNTVLAITVLWIVIYGSGFALTLLQGYLPSPERALANLPNILKGGYDVMALLRLAGWSAGLCFAVTLVGMVLFARRDV